MNGFKLRGNDFYVFYHLQSLIPHNHRSVELRLRYIALISGLSIGTVRTVINRLDAFGFIERRRNGAVPYQYTIRRRYG